MKVFIDTMIGVVGVALAIPLAIAFGLLIYIKLFCSLPELAVAVWEGRKENQSRRN